MSKRERSLVEWKMGISDDIERIDFKERVMKTEEELISRVGGQTDGENISES